MTTKARIESTIIISQCEICKRAPTPKAPLTFLTQLPIPSTITKPIDLTKTTHTLCPVCLNLFARTLIKHDPITPAELAQIFKPRFYEKGRER